MTSGKDRYWSEVARALTPYVPGEQPKSDRPVKLNTNENPYPPSPLVLDALRSGAGEALRLYPDPESLALRQAIGATCGVSPRSVFVGNGSDEVLAHAFCALLKQDRPLLFPDITYSFYPVWCDLYAIRYRTVPLTRDFRICIDDFDPENGGIIFPNPNAPTGCLLPLFEIARLLERNRESAVVIDEAYVDFGGESAIPLVASYPNLLVVQTLSKSRSLAGLRVGFAVGSPDLIEALVRVKDSFNSYPMDRLAEAGAVAALSDRAYFEETRRRIMKTRDLLRESLLELGFTVLPSAANFLFASPPGLPAKELCERLRSRGIFVRHFSRPRIEGFLRITAGTDRECEILVAALREVL